METLEQIRDRILARFPGAEVGIVPNAALPGEASLLVGADKGAEIALYLRDEPSLQFDYCSNVTGVDYLDKEVVETTKATEPDPAGGPPKVVETKTKRLQPGYLEAVYHLYSMALRHGPLVLRMRTGNRTDRVTLPSLTPVWRSCDFQEREVFDLYGVHFTAHPDLRRLLMWDEFEGHPMRRDYVAPDDFEWEPTPHGPVLDRAKAQAGPNPPPPKP
jgi:NADH-quinone oxidoreductase subunit C